MMILPVGKPSRVSSTVKVTSPSIVNDTCLRPPLVLGIRQINILDGDKNSNRRSNTQDLYGRRIETKKDSYRQESFFKKRSREVVLSSHVIYSRLDTEKELNAKMMCALQTKSMRAPEVFEFMPTNQGKYPKSSFRVALRANPSRVYSNNMSSNNLRKSSAKNSVTTTQTTNNVSRLNPGSHTPVNRDLKSMIQASSPIRHLRKKDYIMKSMSREENGQVKERIVIHSKAELPTNSTAADVTDIGAMAKQKSKNEGEIPKVHINSMKKKVKRGKKYLDNILALNPELAPDRLEDILSNIPKISAKYWLAYEVLSKKVLFGHKVTQKREVASLTKLMTLYTALDIVRERNLDAKEFLCKVSSYAGSVGGTTAGLKSGDILNLNDLFFGRFFIIFRNDASFRK